MSMKKAVYIPTGKDKQINKKLNVNGYLATPMGHYWNNRTKRTQYEQ